jgi:hypothetical protein
LTSGYIHMYIPYYQCRAEFTVTIWSLLITFANLNNYNWGNFLTGNNKDQCNTLYGVLCHILKPVHCKLYIGMLTIQMHSFFIKMKSVNFQLFCGTCQCISSSSVNNYQFYIVPGMQTAYKLTYFVSIHILLKPSVSMSLRYTAGKP